MMQTATRTHCSPAPPRAPHLIRRRSPISGSAADLRPLKAPSFRPIPFRSVFSSPRRQSLIPAVASVAAVDAPASISGGEDEGKLLLEVRNLRAVIKESRQEILNGVNLALRQGEVHAITGKNGSGKSTFAKVLAGHPDYEVTGGTATFKGENLLEKEPEERSLAGLFMSFQSPIEIPGVNSINFLNMAYNSHMRKLGQPELGTLEEKGKIVKTGDVSLAAVLEEQGYRAISDVET